MKILEIPERTLMDEIEALAPSHDALGNAYAAGARDALKWLMERGQPPSDSLFQRDKSLEARPH